MNKLTTAPLRTAAMLITAAALSITAVSCHKEKVGTIEPGTSKSNVAVKETDAILAVIDETWSIRFLGTYDDPLYENAGIAHITANGDYTVSVDASNSNVSPKGLEIMYVKVFDGYGTYPNMAIEVKSVRVDGTALDLKAKNYTSTEDKREMRANIYNTYVEKLPSDAHDKDGTVTDMSVYSPCIIDADAFKDGWSKIEVDFSVTGIS